VSAVVEVDGARLLGSLAALRAFGAVGSGVVRPTFSTADMAARHWLRDEMAGAGLDAAIDGVANVIGRSVNSGPALLLGSHSDTQPEGGWLDGAFGVMCAIEVARTLHEHNETNHLAVDVAAWADEEGTYTNFLGSRSFVGDLTDRDLASANVEGETAAEAIERIGLRDVPRAAIELGRHVGYLEAHIEQGPHLGDTRHRIGVVTSIAGMRAMKISFEGRQNHAGTTPMPMRADAGAALFDFGVRVRERLAAIAGPAAVWTIGNAGLEPGAESIVPGAAWCVLQLRDPDEGMLDALEAGVRDLTAEMTAEGPVAVSMVRHREPVPAAAMSADLCRHLGAAADQRVPGAWIEMPSAAAHDAMVLAGALPAAMVFIPSIGGISHDFAEDSSDDDIVTGCQVLADATVSILRDSPPA
jgi:N-carbamoyl-L-amino-acid hydrolase